MMWRLPTEYIEPVDLSNELRCRLLCSLRAREIEMVVDDTALCGLANLLLDLLDAS